MTTCTEFVKLVLDCVNDGISCYQFREQQFNSTIGYIIVNDNVIKNARSFLKMDGPCEDSRGYPFDGQNVRDCAAWITGNKDICVMISPEVAALFDSQPVKPKLAVDDQIFNAFMNRG